MYNGKKINELLKQRQIKKKQLIDHLNITNSGMASIIRGNPTAKTLEQVADFFDVSIDVFFVRKRDSYETPE